jgi:antitoxin PrlF
MNYFFETNDLMMRLFLDFAIEQALKNQDLTPYTLEMSAVARDLIEGVELDYDRTKTIDYAIDMR